MSIKNLNPYIIFNGNAEQAIGLYERALGAKTEGLMRFGDMAGGATKRDADFARRITHAYLKIGDDAIMVSDSRPEDPPFQEGSTHICLDFSDAADMAARFDALAAGGKVTMPLQDTFWGATFGTLTDRFGVRWMFNCTKAKPTSV
jgi:PhnB protein